MSKKRNWYYVLVMTETGPVFVTELDYKTKEAFWEKDKPPLEFISEASAKDIAFGLQQNFHLAYTVNNHKEITSQPYRYDIGDFEWARKESAE